MNITAFAEFCESFQRIIKAEGGFKSERSASGLCSWANSRCILHPLLSRTPAPYLTYQKILRLSLQKTGRIQSLLLPSCLAWVTEQTSCLLPYPPQSQPSKHHPEISAKCRSCHSTTRAPEQLPTPRESRPESRQRPLMPRSARQLRPLYPHLQLLPPPPLHSTRPAFLTLSRTCQTLSCLGAF